MGGKRGKIFLNGDEERKKCQKAYLSCSASLVIRVRHIKTTMRYHFTSTKMVLIKRWTITSVDKAEEKLEPTYTHGTENGTTTLENSLAVPQKVKHRVTV